MSAIERHVDKLGRIVLPMSFRKQLNISENSKVRVSLEDNSIIVTSSELCCALCGCKAELHTNAPLCLKCVQKIKEFL